MPDARDLLGVAVEHATAEVPRASPGQAVGEVRDAIVGTSYESAVDIAVLAEDRLVGLVSIEGLLAADRETTITTLMDPDPPAVAPGEDQEVAAWLM